MKFDPEEISDGDFVDFGAYGRLYVVNSTFGEDAFFVTDRENDRYNPNCAGWNIKRYLAKRIIEYSYDDEDDEDDEDYYDEKEVK